MSGKDKNELRLKHPRKRGEGMAAIRVDGYFVPVVDMSDFTLLDCMETTLGECRSLNNMMFNAGARGVDKIDLGDAGYVIDILGDRLATAEVLLAEYLDRFLHRDGGREAKKEA